jgi:hypothetical protein
LFAKAGLGPAINESIWTNGKIELSDKDLFTSWLYVVVVGNDEDFGGLADVRSHCQVILAEKI